MKTTALILSSIAGLTLSAKTIVLRDGEPLRRDEVVVNLTKDWAMPATVQTIAEMTATRLFAHIRVRVRFIHSKVESMGVEAIPLCVRARPSDKLTPNILGSALIRDHRGVEAVAFYDRLVELLGARPDD